MESATRRFEASIGLIRSTAYMYIAVAASNNFVSRKRDEPEAIASSIFDLSNVN